ncbi:MAG: carboxypeptidase-like regulatory domain-containing protein, partial [Planctomycetota bacterium]|nr:carboxypeptidase-like regulatory domain-containing protein [Planctomycetota bacterium]
MGLALWNATQGRGSAAPLEAMRQRFLESIPKHAPMAEPTGLLEVTSLAKAAGIAAVLVGAISLGLWQWNMHDDSMPDLELTDSMSQAAEEALQPLAGPEADHRQANTIPKTEPDQAPTTRISGVVLGEAGQPLAEADVAIYYWEPWCGTGEETRLKDVRGFGWQTTTDREGQYSIEVPCVPPGDPTLWISGGREYTEQSIRFASKLSHLAPFGPGENAMEPMRLVPAGEVSGVLLKHDGTPAHPAVVQIYPGIDPRHPNRYAVEEDGSFHLEHIPAGIHSIRLSMKGVVRQTTVQVIRGSHIQIPDTVFPEKRPLRVRVVDLKGVDLQRALVEFRPLNPSQQPFYSRHRPGPDGYSDILRPTLDQHEIVVSAEGFTPLESSFRLASNQSELVVQMRPAHMIQVRAVQRGSGDSVGRFILQAEVQEEGQWIPLGMSN